MAGGKTVDSLQIEIEASSTEAEKKVDALAAALERLKKATTGFGNVGDRIKNIGDSAKEAPAAAKTRQKKEALDRAAKPERQTVSASVDLEKAGSQLEATERKIEKAKASIAELKEQIRMLGLAHDKEQGEQAIEKLNEQLSRQYGILDGLIQKREKLSSMLSGGVEEAPKAEPAGDSWEDIKSKLKGSTLGDLIGDTSSAEEAKNLMAEMDDQVALLTIKLEGLGEKIRGAFEKGNQSQVASYAQQIQNVKKQLAELQKTPQTEKGSDTEQVESETSLQKKLGVLENMRNVLQEIQSVRSRISGMKDGNFSGTGKDAKEAFQAQQKQYQSMLGSLSSSKSIWTGLAPKNLFGGLKKDLAALMVMFPKFGAAVKAVKFGLNSLAQPAKMVLGPLAKGFGAITAGAKRAASAIKRMIAAKISDFGKGIAGIGKSVASGIVRPFTKAAEKVSRWKSMLGSALFYSTVFRGMSIISNGIKEGMNNLYQYSRLVGTEFAPAMNSLATSSLYLKNSLGAMAAPLIQALAPVVDLLIDKFVALLNIIGKVFAALTGKSVYTQAKKHAVEYGEAAKDASKATQKFLLGIDELTILDNPAGGGGAGSDFGSMFEETEIPNDISDWANQIREAIENGEWRSVGQLVAEKLNEVVDSWDSYSWGARLGELINNGLNIAYGFLTTFDFAKFGSKIADVFNGLFDTVDWDLLGRTVAAAFNGLFDFIYGFATTLKWHEIGLDISQAINGFLDELDASKAAQAASAFVTGLFDTMNTAIAETNWNVLGEKLGQFVNEVDWQGAIYGALSIITNSLSALKEGIDGFLVQWNWQDTAQQIYTAINDAFGDVDWPGLGTTLSNSFITVFDFLRESIAGIQWDQIGQDVADTLNNLGWTELLSSLAGTLATAFNAIVASLGTLVREIEWETVGEALANSVNDLFEQMDLDGLATGLDHFVRGIINGLSEFIQNTDWKEIGQKIVGALKKIEWKELIADVGTLIGDAIYAALDLIFSDPIGLLEIGVEIVEGILQGIVNQMAGIFNWLEENLVDPIVDGVKSLFGIHSPSKVFSEIGGYLIEGLLEGVTELWNSIVDFFSGGIETLRTNFEQGWETIKTAASTAWENIKTSLSTTWENIKTAAGEKFGAVKEGISNSWEAVKTATGEKWEGIKSSLGSTWENLKTDAGTKFENIKNAVTGKWESVKTDTSEKWDKIKSTLSDSWGDMKSAAEEQFSDIKESISEVWGNIVDDALSWGKDLVSNMADGIRNGIGKITGAVRDVADKVREFLHFSEPDIGPLSDFHTYMPDMLDLMSKGIRDNTYKAVNAASDLADTMSRTLGNIEPVEPKFSVHEDLFASVQPRYSGGNDDAVGVSPQGNQGPDSMEVINAVFAAAQQIVNAINETGDRPVNLDWSSVASGMTSMQNRQNMMYGKTLQNY